MTPAEARALDGFIGSYAELTVDKGRISLTKAAPIANLNAKLPRRGPAHRRDRLRGPVWELRPRRPLPGRQLLPRLPDGGQGDLRAVPPGRRRPHRRGARLRPQRPGGAPPLHRAHHRARAGPGTNPGNDAEVLLKGPYDTFGSGGKNELIRHDFLQDALSLAFAKLVHTSLPGPAAPSATLDPEVRQGRFLFWNNHPDEQPLLRRVRMYGSFPQVGGGDVVAVTTQNNAPNKIHPYLSRTVDDQISFDPATGQVNGVLTLALHNEAPASGLPPRRAW